MKKALGSLLLFAVIELLCGCGGPSPEALKTQGAMASFNEGNAAFDLRKFDEAKQKLLLAVEPGALTEDFRQLALARLAISQAATGEADAGLASIGEIEKAGFVDDEVGFLVAKSYVLQKSGNRAAAQQAFQKARRLNPQVKPFKE